MAGTLAQTIQGEASTPEGQFAVAATIANRAKAGTFPGGSNPNAIVNAPMQYVGYNGTPSPNAIALANAIENGTLDQFGDTGNAVNFQSGPTAAANGLTGGTNIGGNWFSDKFGAPSPNFKPPVYGGSSIADPSQIDPATGKPTSIVGDPASAAAKVPDLGKPVVVGLQPGLTGDIGKWISGIAKSVWEGVWDTTSAAFLNIQNWFIRAFVIIVGLVLLAIGLLKITGYDKVVIQAAKDVALAAV